MVAQDQAAPPNLWYNAVAADNPIHSDVNTQVAPPVAPRSYTIQARMAGTYYVPSYPPDPSRAFPSFTAAGGIFEAINLSVLTGDVVIIVTGDAGIEDGSNKLNQWTESGPGGYTLTIQPDGTIPRVISRSAGTSGTPMFDINGADRFTIDGRFGGGGQYLVLRQATASPGPAVRFTNGCTACTIRNCVVEDYDNSTTRGAVMIGSTGANSGILITGNDIRNTTAGTPGSPMIGVYSGSANNSSITISGNNIYNWTNDGIRIQSANSPATIQDNSFFSNAATPSGNSQIAINVGSITASGHVITGNYIGGQAPYCGGPPWQGSSANNLSFTGIALGAGTASASQVQGNTVQNIRVNSGLSASFTGISVTSGNVAIGTTTGNTIGHPGTANSIELTAATSQPIRGVSTSSSMPIQVENNLIANITASNTGSGAPFYGIYLSVATNAPSSVQNNTVRAIRLAGTGPSSFTGIFASAGLFDIGGTTGNVLGDPGQPAGVQVAGTGASYGILLGTSTAGQVVARNTIANLSVTGATSVYGIHLSGGGNAYRNRVWGLAAGSSGATIRGVNQASGTWTLANNEISILNGDNQNPVQIAGIYQSTPGSYYYNSVYVGGSQSSGSAVHSFAFVRTANVTADLKDNLLYNERTNLAPATGSHCAIANTYSAWTGWSSDYNVLVAADSAAIGRFNATDYDFAGWQSISSWDRRSLSEPAAIIPSALLWTDAAHGNLDVRPSSAYDPPPIVSNVGTPVAGQTTDFGGVDLRGPLPDIGADEITVERALNAAGSLAPASPHYPGNYDGISVQAGGAPTLTGPIYVFRTLSLEGGYVTTGPYILTIVPGANVVRTAGHVVGNLRKYVATGTVDRTFEIGTGASYAPVDLRLYSVETPGYLAATTAAADHPEIGTSGLDAGHSANRYWTLTNGGITFASADATLHFVAEDLDPGSDPSLFLVGKYDAPDWTSPAVGTRTSTSTQATGLTSFSDFAVGEIRKYPITASAGTGGVITPPGVTMVPQGGSQSYRIDADAGHHILDVKVDDVSQGAIPAYTFNDVRAPHAIDATFAIDVFTITATAGPGGTIEPAGAVPVEYGSDRTFTMRADPGYHILEVRVDGVSQGAVDTYTFRQVEADHAIEALFEHDPVTITATAGPGGSIAPSGSVPVPYGHDQSFTIEADSEHHILDVKVDNVSQGPLARYTFTNVVTPHTIEATFEHDPVTITATAGAGGSITPSGVVSVPYDGTQSFAVNADPGWAIADVKVDGASQGPLPTYTFTHVIENHAIDATFRTINVVDAGPASGVITLANPSATVPVTITRDGSGPPIMAFSVQLTVSPELYLPDGKNSITLGEFLNADGGRTVTLVTADLGGGVYVADGTTLGQPCGSDALQGILFNVQVAGSALGGTGSLTINSVLLRDCSNQAIPVVVGAPASVLIDRSAPAVTVVAPNGGETWYVGETRTIEWTGSDPEGIASFGLAWSSDGGATWPDSIANVPGNQTTCSWTVPAAPGATNRVRVTAHDQHGNTGADPSDGNFAIAYHDLTISASSTGHGTIDPSGAVQVAHGSDQLFSMSPDTGYHIDDVLVDGHSVGPVNTYNFTNVTTDHTIVASFAVNTYTLTVSTTGNGTVTKSPDQPRYDYLTVVSLTAHPADGWHFVRWTGDVPGTANPMDVTMDSDKADTARFEVNPVVPTITDLSATQVLQGNPQGGTTQVRLDWTALAETTVEVWRAGFGHYPEYDDAGGTIPVASETYPPGDGWALTSVSAPGGLDLTVARDFYYYVAYTRDGYGTWSPRSNPTGGTLNYHLGDVSDGQTDGAGNNQVGTEDLSLLEVHYGISGNIDPVNYLDVGPTTTMYVDGRPATDNRIDFEDLMMFAINCHEVSQPAVLPQADRSDFLLLAIPTLVHAGDEVEVQLLIQGSGAIHGLSVALRWDAQIIQPTGVEPGDLAISQGALVLSPGAGMADAAILGGSADGFTGDGQLVIYRFHAIASGDPRIDFDSVVARDGRNTNVPVQYGTTTAVNTIVRQGVTGLLPAAPNPARTTTVFRYRLVAPGYADLSVYSSDGRMVRVLDRGARAAREYSIAWDRRDDRGHTVPSGRYFVRLQADHRSFVKSLIVLK